MVNTFRWNGWNLEHTRIHGVTPDEIEMVINFGHLRDIKDEKYRFWGRGQGGRLLQVVHVVDPDGTKYPIHARPLTEKEKRSYRRKYR